MNILVVLALLGLALSQVACDPLSLEDREEWRQFKILHNKEYLNYNDELNHLAIYSYNKKKIEEFNAKESAKVGYTLGLNKYSDLTPDEKARMNGFRVSTDKSATQQVSSDNQKFLDNILKDNSAVPDEVDWRKLPGRVSSVKDQGGCGSCWAFGTVGVLEGQELIKNRTEKANLIDLSPQNILDCCKEGHGCNGGNFDIALAAVADEKGIDSEKFYKYEGVSTFICRYSSRFSVIKNKGSAVVPTGDEESLKKVVARYGPVAVGIDVEGAFAEYSSGVYVDEACKKGALDLNHAVLIVGYGTDKHYGDYWIVKNSWGTSYGQEGYIKMARNRDNMCGIATIATIATF